MSMTPRERVESALRHQTPDRTPIFEYVLLSPIADNLLGRRYAADPANWPCLLDEMGWTAAVRQIAIDRLDLATLLGHDMMYVPQNPLPPQTDDTIPSPEKPTTDDPVKRTEHGIGDIAESIRTQSKDTFLVYTFLKELMAKRHIDLPILSPAYFHGVWTNVDLMQTMLLAPEVAHEHFAMATKVALAQIKEYIALGIDQIGIGGDFSGTVPLISPQCYQTFIVTEVKKLCRAIHDSGQRAINASDGNLWPVIDDFLLGCEVDGYLEIDVHAGMDLGRLKTAFGDRVTFYGNLDCGNTLSFSSPDQVRRHTIECLEAGMPNGGHILTASNAITSSIPMANYLAVVNSYRDMFRLPKLRL